MPLVLLPDMRTLGGGTASAETKLDRLLKLIPTEVATAYLPLAAIGAPRGWAYYELALTIAGVIAVVLVLRKDGEHNQLQPDWRQYVVRCLAFVAWALAVSNPLAPFSAWIDREDVEWLAAFGAAAIPVAGYLLFARTPQPTLPGR